MSLDSAASANDFGTPSSFSDAEPSASEQTASDTDQGGGETTDDGLLDTLTGETETTETDETQGGEEGGEAGDDDGKPIEEPGKKSKDKAAEPTLDPEIEKYARAKGYDVEELGKSKSALASVKAQREMERRMNQMQSEMDKAKKADLNKASKDVMDKVQPESKDPKDLDPVEALQQKFQTELENQMILHDVSSEAELQQKFPQLHAKLMNTYNKLYQGALNEKIEWQRGQDKKAQETAASQQKLQEEYRNICKQADDNLAKLKKDEPEIDKLLIQTGGIEVLDRISKATNIPLEYFKADAKTVKFFAEAAKAINLIKSGKYRETLKKEIEGGIMKAKKGELPAGGDALPDDHEALVWAQAQKSGKGTSF